MSKGESKLPETAPLAEAALDGHGPAGGILLQLRRCDAFFEGHPYISFTVLFFLMFLLMSINNIRWGTGFVWAIDGLEQQYPFFLAEGIWLRGLAENILSGQFLIPQWTMLPAYGADYYATLSSTLGNPFNVIACFSNAANAELLLVVSVVAQLLVAGILFIRYCSYRGFEKYSSVIGAIVYVFSGYTALVFSQLFMLYPLVLAPLLLMGVDYVFEAKTPLVLVGAFALSGFYGVTMVYSACLLLLVYCILRFALLDERKSLATFLLWFARVAVCILVGILISCILLLPGIEAILGEGRLGLERPQSLLYGASYYLTLYMGLLYPATIGADCLYGYAPIALVAIATLALAYRKGDKVAFLLLAMLAIMAVFLCLPIFGRVFNGFAYPNNRWVWAFSLAVGLTVAYALPLVDDMGRQKRRAVVLACSAYLAIGVVIFLTWPERYYAGALLVLLLLVIALHMHGCRPEVWHAAVTATTLGWCGIVFLLWGGLSWPSYDMVWGGPYDVDVASSPARMVADVDVDTGEAYRYDGAEFGNRRNAAIALGVPGSSFYNSYYNNWIDQYHTELGLSSADLNFSHLNLGARTSLEALAGVKYFVAPADDQSHLPSMFSIETATAQDADGRDYVLSEAPSALPLAFSYGRTLSTQSYEGLTMLEKQNALLQAMVIESGDGDVSRIDLSMLEHSSWEGGFNADGGVVDVPESGCVVTVQVEVPAKKVAYVVFEGLAGVDWLQNNSQGSLSLRVICGEEEGSVLEYFPQSHLYAGKKDWVVNLGRSDAVRHNVQVVFSQPGSYEYSSFDVVFEDDVRSAELVADLSKRGYSEVRYEDNEVAGPVYIPAGGRYVYFRVPYSQGWTATVDGERAEIIRANTAFMAVWVDAGQHDIRLEYTTPGLKTGAILSAIGLIAALALGIRARPVNCVVSAA